MNIRRKLLPFLIALVVILLALFELVYFTDPLKKIEIYSFLIDPLILFFILIFLASYLLFTYIFLNSIKGVFFSLFVVLTLFLRMLGYTNWSYIAILFFIVILCIFLFPKRLRAAVKHLNRE